MNQALKCLTHRNLHMCRMMTGGIRLPQHLHFLNFSHCPHHDCCLSQKLLKKEKNESVFHFASGAKKFGLVKPTTCSKRYSGPQQSEHKKGSDVVCFWVTGAGGWCMEPFNRATCTNPALSFSQPVIISPTFPLLFQLIALQRAGICKQAGRRLFTLADCDDEEEDLWGDHALLCLEGECG